MSNLLKHIHSFEQILINNIESNDQFKNNMEHVNDRIYLIRFVKTHSIKSIC